jgi:hypothetical protein
MTLTKKKLGRLLEDMCATRVTDKQYAAILDSFETEPGEGHEWSEQDICEQVRAMLR